MTLPKDFTQQEVFVQKYLDKTGLRYANQVEFGQYTVDFYVAELNLVIEADGVYGHLRKRDKRRDEHLQELGIKYIIHVKEKTYKKIEETLWQELNKLEQLGVDEA